jgi:hypothetical protein
VLGGSGAQLGLIFAAGGAASVVTAAVMGQRPLPRRPLSVMYGAWALATAALIGYGVATSLWPMYLVSAFSSACMTVLLIVWFTLVQRMVPSRFLGRVSSLDWMLSIGLVPVSFIATGPIAELIGVSQTLVLAALLGGTVFLAFLLLPGIRTPSLGPQTASSSPSRS